MCLLKKHAALISAEQKDGALVIKYKKRNANGHE